MALLNSEPIALGSPAPHFSLINAVDEKRYTLNDFATKPVLVVMFICVHCPYVVAVEDRIIQLRKDYESKGVQLLAICANDASQYPDDAPEALKMRALQKDYGFPYLVDESQEVAKAYGAVCTPDIFVYGPERTLAYHGRIDNHWKDASLVTQQELRNALDLLLEGKAPSFDQMPSMGCSIKWKN